MKKGVQLYGFRNELKADFPGTLRQLAELGFDGVEFYSFHGGLSAVELKNLLDELHLQCAGLMYPAEAIRDAASPIYDEAKILDTPAVTHSLITDFTADFPAILANLQLAGKAAHDRGVKFSYHNHWGEGARIDGIPALDRIMAATDPEQFFLEPDVCWLSAAKLDPVETVRKYRDRIVQIHLKDIVDPADPNTMTALGKGSIPLERIVSASCPGKVEWLIYEQDYSADVWRDAQTSLEFLAQLS